MQSVLDGISSAEDCKEEARAFPAKNAQKQTEN
jgi:hypothetical protein